MDKTKAKQDRMAAPIDKKHNPAAYELIWSLLLPSGCKKIVSKTELGDLESVQKPYFFGGAGNMKGVDYEPDGLGSVRIFTAGKVRMQFFKATDLRQAMMESGKAGAGALAEDFQKASKDFLVALFQTDYSAMPPSKKVLVDCSSGLCALLVPPGTLVVQEALDNVMSCGVRRSFTPRVPHDDFKLAVSAKFLLRERILVAMSAA